MREAAILLAALAVSCAQPAALRPEAKEPRIVSLNPCTDAILAEVADPAQIVALSHYSRDPRASSMDAAAAQRFPVTGGTVEEVLALKPDIVVAGSFLPPATAQALQRLGIRTETFGIANSVAESEAQVRRLAAIAGHEERGQELNARIEGALAEAAPVTVSAPVDTLVWQEGGIVAGPDSLIAELLARTGFASHAAARGLGQGAYLPLEQVLADPPALILSAGRQRALTHPALAALSGTRSERLDPSLLYCGGPTIIRAAKRLGALRREIG